MRLVLREDRRSAAGLPRDQGRNNDGQEGRDVTSRRKGIRYQKKRNAPHARGLSCLFKARDPI